MAKTPVTMKIDGYKDREVMMVYYEFEQETDVEGQMSGIPRGGKIIVRVKALNDGTPDLRLLSSPTATALTSKRSGKTRQATLRRSSSPASRLRLALSSSRTSGLNKGKKVKFNN